MKTQIGLLIIAALVGLTGCSHQSVDECHFVTTKFRDGAEFGLKSEDALKGYDSIYLKSVTAVPMDGSKPLEASEMAALEYAFETAFKSSMNGAMKVVDAPGPHTLTVEATIGEVMHSEGMKMPMNVTANNPADRANTYGADSSMTGQMQVAKAPVEGSKVCVCSAHLKVKFLDAQSNELLATFTDGGFGADIEVDESGQTSWSRVSAHMNEWCHDMREEFLAVTK